MNKGLDRAGGRYVLFLNAGDTFVSTFDPVAFLTGGDKVGHVVLGYVIERFGDDTYLRPARYRENAILRSPAHPATAYPDRAYRVLRYDMTYPVRANSNFTARAIALTGAVAGERGSSRVRTRRPVVELRPRGPCSAVARESSAVATPEANRQGRHVAGASAPVVLSNSRFQKVRQIDVRTLPVFGTDRGSVRSLPSRATRDLTRQASGRCNIHQGIPRVYQDGWLARQGVARDDSLGTPSVAKPRSRKPNLNQRAQG